MNSLLWLAATAALLVAQANTAPPVEAQVRRIDALESRGKHGRAAALAEEIAAAHPQDYGWTLRAGWLRFQARHYGRATAHYERAVELSQGSLESRLGLWWSLLYDGHRQRALAELEALEQDYPEAPEVAEAVAFARDRSPVAVRPWASVTGQAYSGHPELRSGVGVQAGVGLTVAEHYSVAASYGYARISYDLADASSLTAGSGGNGNGGGSGGSGAGPGYGRVSGGGQLGSTIEQHQIHASAGPVWPIAGALLQYGFLRDEGLDDVHAVGLSLRWSPRGDIALGTSVTIAGDQVRPRFEPGWKLPVHGKPGVLWLGGKYGRERQPAYLDIPVIFNLPGDIRWGGWVGGQVQLPANFALLANYEVHGVEADSVIGPVDSLAHYITLGLSFVHQ